MTLNFIHKILIVLFILSSQLAFAQTKNAYQAFSFAEDMVLNAQEQQLDKKLNELRNNLEQGFKNKNYAFYNHSFEENRKLIDTTQLFKFLQKMPKGGLLHAHSKGLTDMHWVIKTLQKYPNCYVFTLTDNAEFKFGQLMFFTKNKVPKGFQLLSNTLKSDPKFYDKLYDAQVFRRFSLDSNLQFWPEFEKRFMRIGNITNYRPFFIEYHKKAIQDLIKDNINHLEIRYIFEPLFDDKNANYPADTTIADFGKLLQDIHKTQPDFSMTLIATSLKFFNNQQVESAFEQGFELKNKYPKLVSGFDLVAEEDGHNSVAFFNQVWAKSDSLQNVYQVNLPLYMHAGESNEMENRNIEESTDLNTKRIGHGLNLVWFPEEMQKIKSKNICIEFNPLSNQILGYVGDLRNHPARALMNYGIQGTINSDDPGVFGYEGLSYDFFNAIMAWELDLKAIKKFVFNSIEFSSLNTMDKMKAQKVLENNWNKFVLETTK